MDKIPLIMTASSNHDINKEPDLSSVKSEEAEEGVIGQIAQCRQQTAPTLWDITRLSPGMIRVTTTRKKRSSLQWLSVATLLLLTQKTGAWALVTIAAMPA